MRTMGRAGVALAAMLAMGAATMAAQAHDWVIDKNHSEADFSVKHMGVGTVHGSFHAVTGVVHFEAGNPNVWTVEATIDMNSLDTGVAARDNDLKSARFFDVAQYPTMTFKSTSVKKDAGVGYDVKGDLTMHGVTKPVVLIMEPPAGEEVGMDAKSVHRGFVATTTVNRKDFGLTWNGMLKSGDAVISDQVKIELDVEAVEK